MDANHTEANALRMIDWDDTAFDAQPAALAADGRAPSKRVAPDFRSIPFEPFAVAPLPETWESDSELAWLEFDAAQVEMDLTTRSGSGAKAAARASKSH